MYSYTRISHSHTLHRAWNTWRHVQSLLLCLQVMCITCGTTDYPLCDTDQSTRMCKPTSTQSTNYATTLVTSAPGSRINLQTPTHAHRSGQSLRRRYVRLLESAYYTALVNCLTRQMAFPHQPLCDYFTKEIMRFSSSAYGLLIIETSITHETQECNNSL